MKKHQPVHIYVPNQYYFVTSHTYQQKKLSDKMKGILLNVIQFTSVEKEFFIIAYVILDNHYHIIIKIGTSFSLKVIMKLINGRSSYLFKKHGYKKSKNKIWQNYWDYCIRNEDDLCTHLNYIHYNPIKHGYAKKISEYLYSSFNLYYLVKGKEYIIDIFKKYPVKEYDFE